MTDTIVLWIGAHGYAVVFGLFALGIIGLPVPNELLLSYLGFLIHRGQLHPAPTAAASFFGTVCGMSFNYAIGRTIGCWLVGKFGRLLQVDEAKIGRMHDWFEHRGRWGLVFGYFLPGVRHLTAFAAGTSRISFAEFSVFTSVGALIWTALFIALGFFLENEWSRETARIHRILAIISVCVVAGAGVYLMMKKRIAKRG